MGHRWTHQRSGDLLTLPSLPSGGRPDRLQAPPEPDRLDLCLTAGFLWMLIVLSDSYGTYGLAKPGSIPYPVASEALGLWLWVPPVGLLGIYLILLFPDGRLPSKRWRPL